MVSGIDLGYDESHNPNGSTSTGTSIMQHHQHSATIVTKSALTDTGAITKSNMAKEHSQNSKSRRRRRNVDFAADNVTHEVEHMEDLPGELIWYSQEEYAVIKGRNSEIVKLIKSGEFEENDDYSCRGLEHKLKEIFRQRRANKFNALNAVLEEQDRQINRGGAISDDTLISAAYQTVTVRCAESAHTIACRDYRFSLNYNPDKPATGRRRSSHHNMRKQSSKKKLREQRSNNTEGDNSNAPMKGEKQKKKKEKKEREKEKEKEREKEKQKEKEKDAAEQSPKKKGKVRKMARGASKMYRRMSM